MRPSLNKSDGSAQLNNAEGPAKRDGTRSPSDPGGRPPALERAGAGDGLRFLAALCLTVAVTVALVALLGVSVGAASAAYGRHRWLALFLPLAGLATWWLYRVLGVPFDWRTRDVVERAAAGRGVTAKLAPAIFVGTCATILAGGSVGEEAGALQMGIAAASGIAAAVELDSRYRDLLCCCAMACALSVLLGAPLAAALFAVEAMQFRSPHVSRYLLVAASALAAKLLATGLPVGGLAAEVAVPGPDARTLCCAVAVVAACALAGAAFCWGISRMRPLLSRPRTQIASLAAFGIASSAFLLCFHGDAFSGTGMAQVGTALSGGIDDAYFAGKLLFTMVLLGSGFKGGDIMPSLCIGATLGCFIGTVGGADPGFMAAVGLVACFAACTNCPMAAAVLACEAFGIGGAGWYLAAAWAAALSTRRTGFYDNGDFYPGLARAALERARGAHRAKLR